MTASDEGRAVWAILLAELRTLGRGAFARVYALATIAGVGASTLLAFHWHGGASRWSAVMVDIAPANILGWCGAPILCVALAGVVALAAYRDARTRVGHGALLARPFATATLLFGRLLAQVVACWWPMAAALVGVQCVGALGAALSATWGGTMRTDTLLVFLLLDLPIALALFAAATTLLAIATRSRAAAAVCGLALVGGYGWALAATPSYLLPAVGLVSNFGEQPSDFLATISAETFLHRAATALIAAGLVALCVWRHPRPAHGRRRALGLGAAFCVAGLAAPLGVAWHAAERLALREAWRSAHVLARTQPAADAAIERIHGLVRIAPGRGLELDLTVALRIDSATAPLRFSFNPGFRRQRRPGGFSCIRNPVEDSLAAERCAVFIDGNNFYHGLRRLGVDSQDLDYRRMVQKLVVDGELRETRYYVGRLSGDLPRMRRQSRTLKALRRQGIHVALGRVEKTPCVPTPIRWSACCGK